MYDNIKEKQSETAISNFIYKVGEEIFNSIYSVEEEFILNFLPMYKLGINIDKILNLMSTNYEYSSIQKLIDVIHKKTEEYPRGLTRREQLICITVSYNFSRLLKELENKGTSLVDINKELEKQLSGITYRSLTIQELAVAAM